MKKQSATIARDAICSRAIRISMIVSLHSLVGWCAITLGNTFWVNSANAQITPDASLGNEASTVTPNVNIKGLPADRIDGGARRGANLFHSFSEFNVGDAQRVYFANPTGVENILTRVTGGKLSNILGTLGVNGSANLFLVNPSGILFGENAQLDVGGSFVGTTANGIQFVNQGFFSATEPESPPLLTIKPSALFFNQRQVGKIANKSTAPLADNLAGLRVPDGRSLLLLGGEIVLDGGRLNAPGGRAELAAVAGNGTIGLNVDGNNLSFRVPDDVARANINLDNRAEVNTRAGGGGNIVINTQNLSLAGNSRIRTGIASRLASIDAQAGDININATGIINLTGGFTFISNSVFGAGNSGDINIAAESLYLRDSALLGSTNFGKGNTGNLTINVRDTVSLTNRAFVSTNGLGEGNSGSLIIQAGNLVSFDGSSALSDVQSTAVGNGGNIEITTGSLSLTNGAQLIAETTGKGNAGDVIVKANNTVSFDGVNIINTGEVFPSGIFTRVGETGKGKGGRIEINTNSLSVTNGAQLSASTAGQGEAGSIKVRANSFQGSNGGRILTTTSGSFNAGNIDFNVTDKLSLSGSKTGIFANTTAGSTGNGGTIIIDPRTVTIENGAAIAVDSQGTGIGGNIQLAAGSLTLNQGSISAETRSNTGGNINLQLNDLLLLRNASKISTTAGNQQFGGDGGNITINTPFIVAIPQENSDLTANAFRGRGGKIDITTNGIFGIQSRPSLTELSDITASSQLGVSGEVSINSPDVDPSQGLSELPADVVNVAGLINQNLCTAARRGSEFIVTGRGGLPISPSELLNPDAIWEDWSMGVQQEQSQPKPGKPSNQLQPKGQSSPPIIEAQGWILDGQGNVMLTAKPVTVTRQGSWLHPLDCQRLRGNS